MSDLFQKIKDVLIVLALIAAIVLYVLSISKKNAAISGNYKASHDSISVSKKSEKTVYTKPVETFTRAQFKELFRDEFDQLKKDMTLRGLQSVATVQTSTQSTFTAKTKDTLIASSVDTSLRKAKTWSYRDNVLQIKCIEVDSLRMAWWKHYVGLQLVESVQPRIGIKKLFIWIPRMRIYSGIPSDTNTVITGISLKKF